MPRPEQVELLDAGWRSIFLAMMSEDLGRLKFGTDEDKAGRARPKPLAGTCNQPKVTLKRLLKVLLSNDSKRVFRDLIAKEAAMEPFLARAATLLEKFDEDHAKAIGEAHDSRLSSEPSDFWCEEAVAEKKPREIGTIGTVLHKPVDRQAVPIVR